MPAIHFTPAECAALLHRLEIPDVIAEVFADTDHLQHVADLARPMAEELARQIESSASVTLEDPLNPLPHHEARREVLIESIEGSTWVAVHDNNETSPQKLAAARRALESAARKVEEALGLPDGSITTPEA